MMSKEFKSEHLIFGGEPETFTEDKPPNWLLHKDVKWFYEGYVLTLEVGQSVDTDFNRYTRTK